MAEVILRRCLLEAACFSFVEHVERVYKELIT